MSAKTRVPYVAVIGASDATALELEQAEETGRLLARAGAIVVSGGLGGVMHAAAKGVREEGGISVGLLPGDDRGLGSPHLTVAIATGMGETRNALIVRSSDAVIAIAGEFGTLSEIGFALRLGKPVIGLGTWDLSRRGSTVNAVARAGDAAQAVRLALEQAAKLLDRA